MESIHKDILGFLTTFALRITQANSVLNRSLTETIAGCLSLKNEVISFHPDAPT
jgi:hypothetical protein